jgi:2-polyprenyl-3-methyl-5-hydroxy-6-metoxy-1,4-benzoquinol methylase
MEHLEQNKELTKNKIDFWKKKGSNKPGPGVLKRHNLIADLVKKYYSGIRSSAHVLDIGGREGFLCDALKDKGFQSFYIVDISNEAIEFAKQRGYNGEIRNIENIGYLKMKFDVVIASHVIEHCKEPQKIIDGVYNILNDDGIFFIEVPRQAKEKVPTKFGHWYLFSDKSELTELFDDRWWELLFLHDAPIRAVYRKK